LLFEVRARGILRLILLYCFHQANSPEDVPPVIAAPHHYLISIYRNELFFLAVVQTEGMNMTVVALNLALSQLHRPNKPCVLQMTLVLEFVGQGILSTWLVLYSGFHSLKQLEVLLTISFEVIYLLFCLSLAGIYTTE